MLKVTYTEDEMANDVLHISKRRLADLRKQGVIQGTKTGKGYVYHYLEIEELFKRYRGDVLPETKKGYWTLDSIAHKINRVNYTPKCVYGERTIYEFSFNGLFSICIRIRFLCLFDNRFN